MRRLAALPLASYAVLFAYGCYGAVVIGHWPHYAHPDPKELPARGLLYAVTLFLLAGALSLLALPFGYALWRQVVKLKQRAVPPHRAWVILYTIGAIFWLIDYAALQGFLPWPSLVSWVLD